MDAGTDPPRSVDLLVVALLVFFVSLILIVSGLLLLPLLVP